MSNLRAVLVSLALITLASVGQVIYTIYSSRNICIKNDSLLLQVKACSTRVDNLIDKIRESGICANECNTTQCEAQCVSSPDVICGGLCVASALKDPEEGEEACTTNGNQISKCLDKCASGSGAIAVTSFAIFFSLAISSFIM